MQDLLDRGFGFVMSVPVKKPGAYQVRVAVRDAASEKLGSASQFVEVPDVRKGRLVISDMFLQGKKARAQVSGVQVSGPQDQESEGHDRGQGGEDHPAIRRFREGAQLDLSFIVHNARVDKGSGRPNLEMQLRIYKEDKLVYDGPRSTFSPAQQTDYSRIGGGSTISLKKDMEAGQYTLQLICTDLLQKPEHRTAIQWMDFEITGR